MSTSLVAPVRLLVAVFLSVGTVDSALARQEDEAFKEGVRLYLSNQPEQALEKFKEVLANNPGNEEALRLLDQGGREVFFLMLVKEGEYEATAKRFLELARMARREKVNDPAAISELVEKAMGDNYLDRRDALLDLSANHGEYGAAPFIQYLGNEDSSDLRVNAIFCLTRLAQDAVLPLMAALHSDSERQVWNAVACLGAIRDRRAVPSLVEVYETTGSDTVRQAAADAVRKITGSDVGSLGSSTDLHVEAARAHFRQDAGFTSAGETKDAVWHWRDGAVVAEQVPAFLRHYRLAEQECYAACEDPRARAILCASLAAEKAAVKGAGEVGAEVDEEMASQLAARADVSLAAAGPAVLSRALDFALESDAPAAAAELLAALQGTGRDVPALFAALSSPYKSVRYQAAFALAAAGSQESAVVQVLAEALGEDSLRTALVVDPGGEERNRIVAALEGSGFAVVSADTGALGFARARALPTKEVVVLRSGLQDVTLDQFVYDNDLRVQSSQLVIVADETSAEEVKGLYEGKPKVAGFLVAPFTDETIVQVVSDAAGEAGERQVQAQQMAERAARALATLSPSSLSTVEPALVAALDHAQEDALPSLLQALGKLGPPAALGSVASLFADTSRPEEVRVAAAETAGRIFMRMTEAPGDDILGSFREAARGDSSAAVRVAAAQALGSAGFLSEDQRAELLREQHAP